MRRAALIPQTPRPEEAAAFRERGAAAIDDRLPHVWLEDAAPDLDGSYLVKGLIDCRKLTVIYGPTGDGKTFFTADLAGHIAAGNPWRGRRVRRGLVAYVAAEAGSAILRRFFAWREHHLTEAREERIPLAIITRAVNLLNAVEADRLFRELHALQAEAEVPLVLVIFDTLSRSIAGGDENRSEDMTRAIAVADAIRDELGAATLIVHHTGKDAAKGARGHSALAAAADTVIFVVERVATLEKVRDGVSGHQFPFGLDVVEIGRDPDGDIVSTCLVRHLDGAATARRPQRALSGVARIGLQALEEAIREHGEIMPGTSTIPAGVRAVDIGRWRQRFRLRYGQDGEGDERDAETIRKAFQRAHEHLAQVGAVEVSSPWVWQR